MAKNTARDRKLSKTGGSRKSRGKIRLSPLTLVSAASAAALLIVILVLAVGILRMGRRVREMDQRLVEVTTRDAEQMAILNQTVNLLALDTNTIRAGMGLPTREYPISQSPEEETAAASEELLALLEGIDLTIGRFEQKLSLEQFAALKENSSVLALLEEYSLDAREEPGLSLELFRGKDVFFRVRYLVEERALSVSGPAGRQTIEIGGIDEIASYLKDNVAAVEAHYEALKAEAAALARIETYGEVERVIKDRQLQISRVSEDREAYSRQVSIDGRPLLRLVLQKQSGVFAVGGSTAANIQGYVPLVAAALRELDTRSEREQMLQERRSFLTQTFQDTGISAILEQRGVTVSVEPREDDYFFYYDVQQGEQRIGSVALEKYNTEIYILDSNEVQITSLKTLSQNSTEKKN